MSKIYILIISIFFVTGPLTPIALAQGQGDEPSMQVEIPTDHEQSAQYVDYRTAIQNMQDQQDLALPLFSQRASYQSRIDLALLPDNKQLDVLTFTLVEDAVGFSLLAGALEIANRGGRARIGYDAFSSKVSPELQAYMREKGVDLRAYRPLQLNFKNILYFFKLGIVGFIKYLNMRTHDKVFITNHGTIVGSSNYSKYYYLLAKKEMPDKKERWKAWTFLDREVLIQGPAEIEARNEFEAKWAKQEFWSMGEEVELTDEIRAKYDKELAKYTEFIQSVKYTKKVGDFIKVKNMEYVADSFTLTNKNRKIHRKILKMIKSAKSEVIIENPYVLLPKDIMKELIAAKNRGVSIKIYTNKAGGSDEGDVSKQFKIDLKVLEETGFQVFLNESFYIFHGKVVVVDKENIYWGSYNFDERSKKYNSENGIFFDSRDIAEQIYNRTVDSGIFRGIRLVGQGKKSYKVVYLAKACREFYVKSKVERVQLPQNYIETLIMKIKRPLL